MGHKTFPTGVSRVKESPMGWEKVWFSCKYLEVTQSTLEERLDLEMNFLTAARYFAHKRQNTSRPGQQVHADDLCNGVSFFRMRRHRITDQCSGLPELVLNLLMHVPRGN